MEIAKNFDPHLIPERTTLANPDAITPSDFDWQEMVPERWSGVNLNSEADLIGLGKANLAAMKRYWRQQERELVRRREQLQQFLDELDGQTVEDLQRLAHNYECPAFPSVGFLSGATPEPLDVASRMREQNATTLNVCGWCKYAQNALVRYRYAVTSQCGIMLPWQHKAYGYDGTTRSQLRMPINEFDTPCQLTCCAQEQLELYLEALQQEVTALTTKKAQIVDFIERITAAEKRAEKKPCFPSERPEGWFRDGDKVVCLPHDYSTIPATPIDHFVPGHITYAAKRWTVSVQSEAGVQLNFGGTRIENLCNINLDYLNPAVMLQWEYDYLCAHEDERTRWLAMLEHGREQAWKVLLKAFIKATKKWQI